MLKLQNRWTMAVFLTRAVHGWSTGTHAGTALSFLFSFFSSIAQRNWTRGIFYFIYKLIGGPNIHLTVGVGFIRKHALCYRCFVVKF